MFTPRGTKIPGFRQGVFTFRVRPQYANEHAYPTFGCVARSVAEAHKIAESVGWHARALIEATDIDMCERDKKAMEHIQLEPGLGSQWWPLVVAIAQLGGQLTHRNTFGMQLLTASSGRESNAPFVQFALSADGSLHAEIGSGRKTGERMYSATEMEALQQRFWGDPGVIAPLMTKTYLPGFRWREIALDCFLALTEVFGMTPDDNFSFFNISDRVIVEKQILTQVGDGVFALLPTRSLPN